MDKETREKAEKRLGELFENIGSTSDPKARASMIAELKILGDIVAKEEKAEIDNSRLIVEDDQKAKEFSFREKELSIRENEVDGRMKDDANRAKKEKIEAILRAAGIAVNVIGIAAWAWISIKTMKFEETGTIRSKAFPGLNSLFNKIFKM